MISNLELALLTIVLVYSFLYAYATRLYLQARRELEDEQWQAQLWEQHLDDALFIANS